MGQAKRRGTFEQRRDKAIKRMRWLNVARNIGTAALGGFAIGLAAGLAVWLALVGITWALLN